MMPISRSCCSPQRTFFLLLLLSSSAAAFTTTRQRLAPIALSALKAASEDEAVISGFENWFSSLAQSDLNGSIRHGYFGQLRGLKWTASKADVPSSPVVSVPLSVVLQSDIASDDWDAPLARQLWAECRLGDASKLLGYCNFLKQGSSQDGVPASTAPNALRHWTEQERAVLEQTNAGTQLLALEQRQQALWKGKYDASNAGMSYEQFQWAMEVVHSRAFRGKFGSNAPAESSLVSTLLPSIVPPLGAAIAGFAYVQNTPYPNDAILAALAAVAVLPLGFNLLSSSSDPPSAVLLPMIDSANHLEDADSTIEYDPLTKCFQMSIGPKCLLDYQDDVQLCISYGKRSDPELLLNYGFLPGVSSEDVPSLSEQRARLAEAFNKRNG